ncbi:MAG: hypothetical protein NUV87_01815 [Candidatus Roizmanbacteria bacterium]|nr:hypothetical protein [Candidatus Roizmanbacteria bacterium]MCR4313521.1 hypothetical protein [Candidatus Roizmanbacteria bacterium]
MTRKAENLNQETRSRAIADYIKLIGKIGQALFTESFKSNQKLKRRIVAASRIQKKYNP